MSKYQLMPNMTDEEFAALKEDIRQRGVAVPVEFDEDGNIIDGHHRFRAFAELIEEGADLPMFDKVVRRFPSEDAKMEYVLALNVHRRHLNREQRQELIIKLRMPPYSWTFSKIAQALHVDQSAIIRDKDALPKEIREELETATVVSASGKTFSGGYAPRLLFQTGDRTLKAAASAATGSTAQAQQDRAGELQTKWEVEEGQVWEIPSANPTSKGLSHLLLCGDNSYAPEALFESFDAKARLVVTSPPYNQNIGAFRTSGMQNENRSFIHRMAQAYQDSLPEHEYQNQQVSMLDMCLACTTDDASFFYNHKIRYRDKVAMSPLKWIDRCNWELRQEIIWNRGSSVTLNARMFIPAEERIYWLFKGEEFYFVDTIEAKSWTTIWTFAAQNTESVSAPFPDELPRRCIVACSEPRDIVFDPYLGSGTVMAVAETLGRICYGVEIAPPYCAVTLERMSQMGLEPRLL